ncbi:MAG: aldehyde dehydrogenase family protein, partial [Burkholderiales bacterium]|nr:aldehyde dehydrogenase family protein [Burkholderiales bacterium]
MTIADITREVAGALPEGMYIGGEFVEATGGQRIETIDPGTGRSFADFPAGRTEDVDRAVVGSRRALGGPWRQVTPAQRGAILSRAATLIRRDAQRLSLIETLDSGKPLAESRGDIETAAAYFAYYAGIADKLQGDTIPLG